MHTLYCDMDQVLVNFLLGARKVLGYEFNHPMLGEDATKWPIIDKHSGFWLGLEWMPNAKTLWEAIRHHKPHILSACPENDAPTCRDEKIIWCKRELNVPTERIQIVTRKEKKLFAKTNNIQNVLIDDHPKNILEWKEAGGIGIHHHTVPETLQTLRKLGL